jgi:hypothetical protein
MNGRGSILHMDKIFLFLISLQTGCEAIQPPIKWVPGILFPGVKEPRSEADHSPGSSVEARNGGAYTSTPPYVFIA